MKMNAILLPEFGSADNLVFGETDKPVPGEGQILIRVRATSVNRPDVIQRQGNYAPPPGDSEILGLEVAGDVEELGAGVSQWHVGDRVFALIGGGGYAEYAVAWADHSMEIPGNLSYEQAACICETYITAWLNVFSIGGLENHQAVLLHGGGGGVNTSALQLCQNLVPETVTIVTASSGKVQRVSDLGANHVIDYRNENFAERIREITDKKGVNVILDHIGAAYLADNMKSLAVGGTLMLIGVMGGIKAELNLAMAMVKRQRIIGSVLRSRPLEEKARIIAEFGNTVMPLFADGRIAPLISETYALQDAADGHRAMESGSHFGKIVLSVAAP